MNFLKRSLLCLSLCFSCGDFTEKNLKESAEQATEERLVSLLLSDNNLINQGEFSLEKMIANLGLFVVAPEVSYLEGRIDKLEGQITQYCQSISVVNNVSTEQVQALKKPIRDTWKEAMSSYHVLESMMFGPAKDVSSTAMSSLYSFSGEGKCRVDLSLLQVGRGRFPRFDVITNYNVRGLDALEPLLFSDPNISRCKRPHERLKKWFSTPLIEREKTVCQYMTHLSKDLKTKAKELADAWSPSGKHHTASMLKGEQGTLIEVVNKISQSLFHLDTVVKDVKLAYPAGFELRIDDQIKKCNKESCPENTEHLYADMAFESLISSYKGFLNLFTGTDSNKGIDGFGIDDLLRSRGHSKIASDIIKFTNQAIEKLEKINEKESFKTILEGLDPVKCEQTTSENRLVEACALIWDIRKVTNILKNEYLLALTELSAPRQAQGDND